VNAKNLMHLKGELNKNGVIVSFTGIFSQSIIQEIGDALRKGMQNEDYMDRNYYNVFSIFIEQTQNITNYIGKKSMNEQIDSEFMNSGIVSIGKANDKHFVYSANWVENSDVDSLIERLELVKSKNKDELKKLYNEQLRKNGDDETKGMGLGLLEMARKGTNSIEYSFSRKNHKYSFFTLNISI
jgi:hypothetical protein